MNSVSENFETSNVGKRWTQYEDNTLQNHITNENYNYDNIAIEFKRTPTGIRSRVFQKFIYPEYNNGKDISYLSNKYKINQEILEIYITKEKDKIYISNSKISKKDKYDKILELLMRQDKLDMISELLLKQDKLDKILELLIQIQNKLQ